jgi:hypothetical protein
VWLGAAETITVYSGVVTSSGANIGDPAAQWKAFVDFGCAPFVASRRELPRWWTTNPIREKHRYAKAATSRPAATQPTARQRVEMILAGRDYPYLRPEDRPLAIEAALAGNFNATWGLAISGYSRDAADALLQIATDKSFGATTRGYAAMGLGNFSGRLSREEKELICIAIATAIQQEGRSVPGEFVRLMNRLDSAPLVAELLGEDLAGSRFEIDVLARLSGDAAGQRLWQLYEQLRGRAVTEVASRIAVIGNAMLDRKDKRGADVLLSLLPKGTGLDNQVRHNTYSALARRIGNSFGYAAVNYHPDLEAAIPKMVEWWNNNQQQFEFDRPTTRPKE